LSPEDRQIEIDQITYKSGKMMKSAIFGLIILIVFIPYSLYLVLKEEMFKPMAMTFSFALVEQ
jgi:cobalt-zinc-cadmium resistance protein CzcA